ncbi:YebC/PmpR family DNA-binding transcriptional regulator [Patescibacteria group bacterium]
MSGHSKWSTIKRQKEANDKARGKTFSKLSRGISLAAKQGGSNPETNYKLKIAIETAKSENMPKANIDRVLTKAAENPDLTEITYEGFGPSGVQIMVEVATDNKNRSAQEIKKVFEKGGGRFAGPGAVSFNFDSMGYLLIKKLRDTEGQMLEIIDHGVRDVVEGEEGIEVYVDPEKLTTTRNMLEQKYEILSFDLTKKPKTVAKVEEERTRERTMSLLQSLDDMEDVQKVFTNIE